MIDGYSEGFSCGVMFPSFRDLSNPFVIHKMTDTEHIKGLSPSTRGSHPSCESAPKVLTKKKKKDGYGLFQNSIYHIFINRLLALQILIDFRCMLFKVDEVQRLRVVFYTAWK